MSNTDGAAPAAAGGGELSIAQAVGVLNNRPKDENEPATPPPERPRATPPPAQPEQPSPDEDDAAADEDQPPGEAEGEEAADEDLPPLKPHKALTAAEREVFESLPRLAQEAWNQRERDRDTFYRKGHDEAAAAIRKAQEKEQAAEQRQREYEQLLPEAYAEKRGQFDRDFADIKSQADVDAMRVNDPMRWMAFQDAKSAVWAKYNEAQTAGQRQMQEQSERYKAYQTAETVKVMDYLAREKVGDVEKVSKQVRETLIDVYGFADEELAAFWHSGQPLYLADSRIQKMAVDATRWRDLQAQKAAAPDSRKPLPPVQRPGTATNRGEASNVQLKILSDKLSKTGRLEDAVAYQNAKSAAARRRG
jgi:hypothetical protein